MNRDTKLSQIRFTDFPKICRFCTKNDICAPIFKQQQQGHQNQEQDESHRLVDIPNLILTLTTIEVKPDDDLPMFLCKICFDKLLECQHFRQQCIESTKFLQKIKLEHKKIKAEKEDQEEEEEETEDHNYNDASDNDNDVADDLVDPANHNDEVSMVVPFEQIYNVSIIKAETFDIVKEEVKEPPKKQARKKYPKRTEEEKKAAREKRKEKKERKRLERYICQICGASVISLNNHIQSVHTEKTYDIECDICGKKFCSFGRMNEHMRMVHIDARRYKCTICPNAFNAKCILVKHMQTHTGEKNFRCDMCDRAFRAKSTLKKHRLSHTQERTFLCNYCDKRFSSRNGLRNHVVVHTGDRPHKCGICPMTFKFSSTASQHRKAHVNRQPYQCQTCGMDFNSISLYRTHMKIHKKDDEVLSNIPQFQNNVIPQQLEEEHQQQHIQPQLSNTADPDRTINNIVNDEMIPYDIQQQKFDSQHQANIQYSSVDAQFRDPYSKKKIR